MGRSVFSFLLDNTFPEYCSNSGTALMEVMVFATLLPATSVRVSPTKRLDLLYNTFLSSVVFGKGDVAPGTPTPPINILFVVLDVIVLDTATPTVSNTSSLVGN